MNEQGLYFTRGISRPWSHHKEKESVNSSSIPRWGLRKFLKVGLWTAVVDYRNDPNSLPSLEPYPLPCRSEVSSHHLLNLAGLVILLGHQIAPPVTACHVEPRPALLALSWLPTQLLCEHTWAGLLDGDRHMTQSLLSLQAVTTRQLDQEIRRLVQQLIPAHLQSIDIWAK